MSDKQAVWLSEYLQCLNATEAARRAGYKWPDKMGAQNKALFADEIKSLLAARIPSPEAVVSRVADMAFSDLAEYIDSDGRIDIERLKEGGRGYLLKRYRHTRQTSTRKDGGEYESESWDAEFYAADSALSKLMRYHSLYNDKVTVTWRDKVPADKQELVDQFFKTAVGVAGQQVDDD